MMNKLKIFKYVFLYHIMEVLKPSNLPYFTEKKEPPKDNEKFKNEKDKFKKYFKENI